MDDSSWSSWGWRRTKDVGLKEKSVLTRAGAVLKEWKEPKDPLDRAIRYRRYLLQTPLQARLGFIAWSAGLICYATIGFRARLRRTSILTGVLVMICTPELVPWRS